MVWCGGVLRACGWFGLESLPVVGEGGEGRGGGGEGRVRRWRVGCACTGEGHDGLVWCTRVCVCGAVVVWWACTWIQGEKQEQNIRLPLEEAKEQCYHIAEREEAREVVCGGWCCGLEGEINSQRK